MRSYFIKPLGNFVRLILEIHFCVACHIQEQIPSRIAQSPTSFDIRSNISILNVNGIIVFFWKIRAPCVVSNCSIPFFDRIIAHDGVSCGVEYLIKQVNKEICFQPSQVAF